MDDEDQLESFRQYILEQLGGLDINADYDDDSDYSLSDDDELRDATVWYEPLDEAYLATLRSASQAVQDDQAESGELAPEAEQSDESDAANPSPQDHETGLPDEVRVDQHDTDESDRGTQAVPTRQAEQSSQAEDDGSSAAQSDAGEQSVETPVYPPKKKKSKKKKKGPAADNDDVDNEMLNRDDMEKIYEPAMSPDERFRLAMDKFRKERIFVTYSNQILETYFSHGAMNVHPEQETATREAGVEVMTEVDFEYVAASFLSAFLFNSGNWHETVYFEMAPRVVHAFLKYVLVRHVVPEYKDSLRKAIKVAQLAKIEAPKCKVFNGLMPDDLNQTCSILFVDEYAYDILPNSSIPLMEQVVGVKSANDVKLVDSNRKYARIVRVEQGQSVQLPASSSSSSSSSDAEAPAVDEATSDATSDTTSISSGSGPKVISLSKLVLESMSVDDLRLVPTAGESEFSILVSSKAAEQVSEGSIVWGTFYTLSNGRVFARPLMGFPSFYMEEDDESLY
ncbi:Argonaute siRNA chaperone complex subunit Arb1-domain-containing protein [Mortierella sp. GBAus27b]|nr:hypothetical protein BGX31_002444 [Mortierella sp. GBA43]KAI8351865.1 Argonaute siRNA chaperone complex subunit Arb1-domain-containing protein [Mortierella sp. GBAus27b]